jgi:predicted phosphodiesterase
VLESAGLGVPFYVFGHTHVAADVPLPGSSARYLNPGTWSATTRRVPGGDRRCGVVVIDDGETGPRAEVRILA